MRRSIPHVVPFETEESTQRHVDGISCRTTAAGVHDANGNGRWCVDCGTALGEEVSWHPDGQDVPPWFFALVGIGVALIVGAAIALAAYGRNSGPHPGTVGGPPVPSVFPWPSGAEWRPTSTPDPGVRPFMVD